MPDWGDYLSANGGLTRYTSKEGFKFLQDEYYAEVKKRIRYCKKLLKEHEDAFINYVLAELYDRCNEDESPGYLYKRPVRYYCLKALEFDLDLTPAKELLKRVKTWIEFLGGDSGKNIMPDLDVDFGER